MSCIAGAKYTMKATLVNQSNQSTIEDDSYGEFESKQDNYSGAMKRVWKKPVEVTAGVYDSAQEFNCSVRTVNLRNSEGEKWAKKYDYNEILKIKYSSNFVITERDRITNIKDAKSKFLWTESNGDPTIFDVVQVSPVIGPFNNQIENYAIVHRAQAQ